VVDTKGNLHVFNNAMLKASHYSQANLAEMRNIAALYHDPTRRDEIWQEKGQC